MELILKKKTNKINYGYMKKWRYGEYGWTSALETGIIINSVSVSFSIIGFWLGINRS